MARFVGKQRDMGSELITRLLVFFVLILVLLVLLNWVAPDLMHGLLLALRLPDPGAPGIGR
jgi:hypothetical protein